MPIMRELCEALQRRGFLVLQKDDQILLHRGSHDQDEQILRDWGLTVFPFNGPHWRACISTQHADPIHILSSVRSFASENCGGLAGAVDPPVPVRNLEPGIALFAKVLPLWSIRTLMSCQGHPGEHERAQVPTIWFPTDAVKDQAHALLDTQAHLQEFQPLKFTYSTETANEWNNQWVQIRPAIRGGKEELAAILRQAMAGANPAPQPTSDGLYDQIRVAAVAMFRRAVGT